MSYDIIAVPKLRKELKRLVNKYPSLKKEYLQLLNILEENPEHGIPIGHIVIKFV